MPHLLDLFCGSGGWTKAAMARGWTCTGIDIVNHGYPRRFICEKLPTAAPISHFGSFDAIVASPPCEQYARRHLPCIRDHQPIDTRLLREAIWDATNGNLPMVVECSKFAARHVPGAWIWRQYALWGALPALRIEPPQDKTKKSGKNPAARAEIPHDLADWIITHFEACLFHKNGVGRTRPRKDRNGPLADTQRPPRMAAAEPPILVQPMRPVA